MDSTELQHEIKKLLKEMGWTIARAARHIYYEENDTDNEDEINKFIEKFKKKLSRTTTSIEYLENIQRILCEQRSAKHCEEIKPRHLKLQYISESIYREIIMISHELDRDISKKYRDK